MLEKLEKGENIIIFPEGTRGEAGKLGRFRGGVGRILERRPDVPLLPAFLLGGEKAMPRKAAVPLPLWHQVTIGPPLSVSDDPGEITEVLRESILALARSETGARHRRRAERRESFVVAVLGIDGSGKSTLSRRLAVELSTKGNTCLIGEGLELFAEGRARATQPLVKERLRAWLQARSKHAESLARYKIPKLTELLLRDALLGEAKRWYGPDVVIMDGSPLLNMTAWSVLYREEPLSEAFCAQVVGILAGRTPSTASHKALFEEFPVLRTMQRLRLTRLSLPDAIVFLDVEPTVAMQRIRARGEDVQVHETEEKLARLRAAYTQVVAATKKELGRPAYVFSGDQDADYVSAAVLGLIAQERGVDEEGEHGG
jgi:thymidylate kinase